MISVNPLALASQVDGGSRPRWGHSADAAARQRSPSCPLALRACFATTLASIAWYRCRPLRTAPSDSLQVICSWAQPGPRYQPAPRQPQTDIGKGPGRLWQAGVGVDRGDAVPRWIFRAWRVTCHQAWLRSPDAAARRYRLVVSETGTQEWQPVRQRPPRAAAGAALWLVTPPVVHLLGGKAAASALAPSGGALPTWHRFRAQLAAACITPDLVYESAGAICAAASWNPAGRPLTHPVPPEHHLS